MKDETSLKQHWQIGVISYLVVSGLCIAGIKIQEKVGVAVFLK